MFVGVQMTAFGIILFFSVVMFYKIAEPKNIIDDAGSNLIYEFRRINITSHQVSEQINSINDEKVKIPIDKFGIF